MEHNSRSNSGEKSGGANYDSYRCRIDNANIGHDNETDNCKRGSSHSEIDYQGTLTSDDKTSSRASSSHDISDDTKSDECKHSSTQTAGADSDVSKQTPQRSVSVQNDEPNKAKPFSTQLYDMLNIETDAGSQAVQWLTDGRGFVIRNQMQFEQLLPKYFDTCIFQSFLRRLYRWGFKQTDKSTAGSGHYAFSHEVFRKGNNIHQNMKPLPRNKKAPQEVKQNGTSHNETITLNFQNSAGLQSRGDGFASAEEFTASPSPLEHGRVANENVSRLPPQLASAQNELMQLVNTIVATYSSSPVLLSSLQNDLTNSLRGIPLAQLNSIQQQVSIPSTDETQTASTASQEPIVSIVDGIIRFLIQRQSSFAQPGVAVQATNYITTTNPVQQQSTTPPLLSGAFQGYDNQTPHSFLPGSPLHFFRGNPFLQTKAPALANNTDTTTTATSSTNGSEDANGGETAASDTSFSTTRASSLDNNLAPPMNNRKRERSPSPPASDF